MAALLIQSSVAKAFSNLDSTRSRNTSLEKRKEGWTEAWGIDPAQEKDDDVKTWENDEDAMVSSLLVTTYPQSAVTLFQFRPAWFEQLLLRIAGIAHIVVNSSYAATESTGVLPCLRVLQPNSTILVGHQQPDQKERPYSSIAEYLVSSRDDCKLDGGLSEAQQSQARMIQTLITSELNPLQEFLRYNDTQAWENIYRPQYIEASADNAWLPIGSWFQAWSVRKVGQNRYQQWTLEQAKARAKTGYRSLETQLGEQQYLLGTTKPTTVDALLWAHLAETLCDVHLVVIVAEYPRLTDYFQRIYETFFRPSHDETEEWKKWNHAENQRNAFAHIPLMEKVDGNSGVEFQDAFELMQALSVHTRNLRDTLLDTKLARIHEPKPSNKRHNTWYRWRMGGELYPEKKEDEEKEKQPEDERLARWKSDQKRNDELWLSGVLGVAVLVVFVASSKTSKA